MGWHNCGDSAVPRACALCGRIWSPLIAVDPPPLISSDNLSDRQRSLARVRAYWSENSIACACARNGLQKLQTFRQVIARLCHQRPLRA